MKTQKVIISRYRNQPKSLWAVESAIPLESNLELELRAQGYRAQNPDRIFKVVSMGRLVTYIGSAAFKEYEYHQIFNQGQK